MYVQHDMWLRPDAGYGFLDAATEIPGVVSVAMLGAEMRELENFMGSAWENMG